MISGDMNLEASSRTNAFGHCHRAEGKEIRKSTKETYVDNERGNPQGTRGKPQHYAETEIKMAEMGLL